MQKRMKNTGVERQREQWQKLTEESENENNDDRNSPMRAKSKQQFM
jgi:hypothetical protein